MAPNKAREVIENVASISRSYGLSRKKTVIIPPSLAWVSEIQQSRLLVQEPLECLALVFGVWVLPVKDGDVLY